MANINQKPTYHNNGGYSGFDLSHRNAFTSTVGQLLPVYCDELYPGDHVKITANMFTRTEPLQKAAFTRVTEHIDYFFVPFTQLYSLFDAFIYSVDDIKTSFVDDVTSLNDYLPAITGNVLQSVLVPWYAGGVYSEMSKDEFGEPKFYNACQLLDMLGYSSKWQNNANMPDWTNVPKLNAFRLAAYQKIFYDYYRLTDWTVNDNRAYNLDAWFEGDINSGAVVQRLLTLHYRPWKKDYFTNVLPSPLVSGASNNILPNITSEINQWLDNSSSIYTKPLDSESTPVDLGESDRATQVNISQMSTASIRTAFAYEKLLEITRRAGKHYDLQTLAHFGVKTPRRVDGDVFYLGSQSSDIQINDVISTAQTEQGSLGEIGGKGYGNMNGNGIDFTANCHGIIMAIYSAVPESDYAHTGIARQNTYLKKYDYFFPELDDIGMQPLFGYDVNFSPAGAQTNNTIYGWQYRFMESKQKYDQFHGHFLTQNTGWITSRNPELVISDPATRYYISPNYLNYIMEVSYNMSGKTRCSTDPLIHDLFFKSYKTSKMSTYGLPSL